MKIATICLALAAACLSTTASSANLLANSNFDDGINHWTWYSEFQPLVAHHVDAVDGFPDSPSLMMTGTREGVMGSDCIVMTAQSVDLFATAKVDVDPGVPTFLQSAAVRVDTYSDNACTTLTVDQSVGLTLTWADIGGVWLTMSAIGVALPDTTNSVTVTLVGHMVPPFTGTAHFDSIRFGPTGTTPVTLQSFGID